MEPSNPEPEKYAALSREYIERADGYLRAGDRVQASEKGWGAVAVAVKSIAEQRGWNHQGHRLLNDIASLLAEEWGRPDVRRLFIIARDLHINFYEDLMDLGDIAASVGDAKTLLQELETLRQRPPRPPSIRNSEQRNRWRRLTGETLPIAAGPGNAP